MISPELQNYIAEQRKAGCTDTDILAALKLAGYSEADAQTALGMSATVTPPKKLPPIFIIIPLVIIMSSAVAATVFFQAWGKVASGEIKAKPTLATSSPTPSPIISPQAGVTTYTTKTTPSFSFSYPSNWSAPTESDNGISLQTPSSLFDPLSFAYFNIIDYGPPANTDPAVIKYDMDANFGAYLDGSAFNAPNTALHEKLISNAKKTIDGRAAAINVYTQADESTPPTTSVIADCEIKVDDQRIMSFTIGLKSVSDGSSGPAHDAYMGIINSIHFY